MYYFRNGAIVDPNDIYSWEVSYEWTDNFNILGLIVFSLVTGISIAVIGEPAKPLLKFVSALASKMHMHLPLELLFIWSKCICCIWYGKSNLYFLIVVMTKVTKWIIMLAPIGVCFLIAGQIVKMTNIKETFASLGWYFATVMLGMIIHGFIILPALFGKESFS